MEANKALIAYEKAIAIGMYDTTGATTYRGKDPVRQFWEDQITRTALERFLVPFVDAVRPPWGAAHGLFAIYEFERIPAR